jgi:hypothetical protein
LRLADDSQHFRVVIVPIRNLIGWNRSGNVVGKKIDAARCTTYLIDGVVEDARSLVITLVIVEVALIRATKLQQVVALDPAQVIPKLVVLAVPKA